MANPRLLDLIRRDPTADPEPPAERPRPRSLGADARPVEGSGRHRRWVVGLLLAVVFVAFGGIVWLAYQDGAGAGGDVPLIRADASPFKVSPDDPGGLEVPNQRLAVNVLLGSEPPAESVEPVAVTPIVMEEARIPPPPSAEEPPAAPAPAEAAPAASTPAQPAPAQRPTVTAPAAPTPAATAARPEAAPPTVTGGTANGARGIRIQLAAVNDEGRARVAMNEMWQAYREVLGGLEPRIERAEVGDAVFFRIQAGPFADRGAANAACDRLKERQAACIVVGG